MKCMRLTDQDVLAMVRDQGLERLDQLDYAVLERNGESALFPLKAGIRPAICQLPLQQSPFRIRYRK